MPRPTKMTEEAKSRILLSLQAGSFLKIAAASAGISEATLHRYLAGTRPEHRAFRRAARQAIADGEVRMVGGIIRAAPTNPAAAMRLLERRHPGRWGLARANLTGSVADEIPDDDPAPVEEKSPTFMERVIQMPPEWQHPMIIMMTAAARGETPESLFEGVDRLAGVRDGPLEFPWWKLPTWELPTDGHDPDVADDPAAPDEDEDRDPAEDDD